LATGQRENLIKKIIMFWWQPVETYIVNMAISQFFSSKGGEFGHIIFHPKKKKKTWNQWWIYQNWGGFIY